MIESFEEFQEKTIRKWKMIFRICKTFMVFYQFSESISGESAIKLWDIQWEILAQSTVASIFEAFYAA